MNPRPDLKIALVLLWRDGCVLATKRRKDADHLPDLWEFPGGKCEDGEAPEACAVREAREELGIEVRGVRARQPIVWDYPERRVTLHPIDCVLESGEPRALQSAGMRWLSRRELRVEDFPPANAALLTALQAEPSGEKAEG